MKCPADGARLNCTDTRPSGTNMRRIYRCPVCEGKFYTLEVLREKHSDDLLPAHPIAHKKALISLKARILKAIEGIQP